LLGYVAFALWVLLPWRGFFLEHPFLNTGGVYLHPIFPGVPQTSLSLHSCPPGDRGLKPREIRVYANNGYSGQVYLFEAWPDTTGWAVSLTWTAASSRCHLSNAVVDIETCCSTYSGAWNGARVEFVNDCNLDMRVRLQRPSGIGRQAKWAK
jgi:hypothetical protein